MFELAVGYPGYHHYFAELDDIPISTGTVFIGNQYASLAFAATMIEARRQGGQRYC